MTDSHLSLEYVLEPRAKEKPGHEWVTWAFQQGVRFPFEDAKIFSDMIAGNNIQTSFECGFAPFSDAKLCQYSTPLMAREKRMIINSMLILYHNNNVQDHKYEAKSYMRPGNISINAMIQA